MPEQAARTPGAAVAAGRRAAPPHDTRRVRAVAFLGAALLLLAAAALASLMVGSRSMAPSVVWEALVHPGHDWATAVVREQRVPRTVLAVLAGAALGVAGALTQSLTRNPLADPGVLGINAGASLAVVGAVALSGFVGIWFYLWFSFAGAAVAAVAVYLLAAVGGAVATPLRLALGGVAVSAAASSLVQTVILADQNAFNEFRFWAAGSLEGRRGEVIAAVGPFLGVGLLLALLVAPGLNALALGDDAARALGVRAGRVRGTTTLAVALLCGGATAAIGPVGFVGLGVPHLVRGLLGPDVRWLVPGSALLGAALLLVADVAGRRLLPGSEVQVGLLTAIVGGPVFVLLVRRRREAL